MPKNFLFGFEDVVGEDVNVFGGMAGDDYSLLKNNLYLQMTNRVTWELCISFG